MAAAVWLCVVHIWKARNEIVFEGTIFSPANVLHAVYMRVKESHAVGHGNMNVGAICHEVQVGCIFPPDQWIKGNMDVSLLIQIRFKIKQLTWYSKKYFIEYQFINVFKTINFLSIHFDCS